MRRIALSRVVLPVSGALLLAAALALWHGVRVPPPRLEVAPRPSHASSPQGLRVEAEGASFVGRRDGALVFRAHAPEPSLHFAAERPADVDVVLENVHPEAVVRLEGRARSETHVVTRRLRFDLPAGGEAAAHYGFPPRARYRFAAIGDTGGEYGLEASLARAGAKGADFLLLLGDVGYTPDAFPHAEATLRETPIPVFAAIGNHDLGDGLDPGEVFTRVLGPRNGVFRLGGVTFANIDTASDTWLPMRGERGALLRALAAQRGADAGPLIVYTHRPLDDPREDTDGDGEHALNRAWESSWLRGTLLDLGASALLAGHIHSNHQFDDQGLATWIAGSGLLQGEEAPPAMLVGEFAPGGPVELRWDD